MLKLETKEQTNKDLIKTLVNFQSIILKSSRLLTVRQKTLGIWSGVVDCGGLQRSRWDEKRSYQFSGGGASQDPSHPALPHFEHIPSAVLAPPPFSSMPLAP